MLSRELNEINLKKKSEKKTFMCIGGMGHAVSIATGVALKKKIKSSMFGWGWVNNNAFRITCHKCKVKNMFHIVFNNNSHDLLVDRRLRLRVLNIIK